MSDKFYGYYDVVSHLMETLIAAGCRKVEHGMVQSYALDKVNVTPYAYIMPSTVIPNIPMSQFSFDLFVGDIKRFDDLNEREQVNPRHMHDNLIDILDETQYILSSALMKYSKAVPLNQDGLYIQLLNSPSLDPFEEKGDEVFAGYLCQVTFQINQRLGKC